MKIFSAIWFFIPSFHFSIRRCPLSLIVNENVDNFGVRCVNSSEKRIFPLLNIRSRNEATKCNIMLMLRQSLLLSIHFLMDDMENLFDVTDFFGGGKLSWTASTEKLFYHAAMSLLQLCTHCVIYKFSLLICYREVIIKFISIVNRA